MTCSICLTTTGRERGSRRLASARGGVLSTVIGRATASPLALRDRGRHGRAASPYAPARPGHQHQQPSHTRILNNSV